MHVKGAQPTIYKGCVQGLPKKEKEKNTCYSSRTRQNIN